MQGQIDRERELWLVGRQDEVWAEPEEGPVDGRDDERHLGKGCRVSYDGVWAVRREGFLTGSDIIKSVLLT